MLFSPAVRPSSSFSCRRRHSRETHTNSICIISFRRGPGSDRPTDAGFGCGLLYYYSRVSALVFGLNAVIISRLSLVTLAVTAAATVQTLHFVAGRSLPRVLVGRTATGPERIPKFSIRPHALQARGQVSPLCPGTQTFFSETKRGCFLIKIGRKKNRKIHRNLSLFPPGLKPYFHDNVRSLYNSNRS